MGVSEKWRGICRGNEEGLGELAERRFNFSMQRENG
jgi:hypothetical protein